MQVGGVSRFDAVLAAAVTVLAMVEIAVEPLDGHRAVAAACLLPMTVALAWRVRAPLVPAVATIVLVPLLTAAGVSLNAMLTVLVVVALTAYSLGAHLSWRRGAPAAAALAAAGLVSVVLDDRGIPGNAAFALLVVAAAYGTGVATRARRSYVRALEQRAELLVERAALLEARSKDAAAAAVTAERARIARELHDVVAHHLTVIGLQAGGVRRLLLPEQRQEREALTLVESSGRQAQEDMQHLLTLLRSDGTGADLLPQPGLARLRDLVADSEAAGLPVDVEVSGDVSTLPPGVDLAAYRIVQEALTNCRKHAAATRASVVVRATPGSVTVEVVDDGAGDAAPSPGGYGLVGMRERAALYGGTLDAGPTAGGGFRVAATLHFRGATT